MDKEAQSMVQSPSNEDYIFLNFQQSDIITSIKTIE
jgi:hypothetical protein